MPFVFVMVGGALGAGARFLTSRAGLALFGPSFPYATLAVNLIGGLLMGLLTGALVRGGATAEPLRLFLGVGVLGGFTTFSSFSLDVVVMIQRGAFGLALFYALLSVAGSVLALFAGLGIARAMNGGSWA